MLTHDMKQIIENLNNSYKRYYAESVLTALQKDFYKNYFPDFNSVKFFYNEIEKQYIENVKMLMFIESQYTENQKIKTLPELRYQAQETGKNLFKQWKSLNF